MVKKLARLIANFISLSRAYPFVTFICPSLSMCSNLSADLSRSSSSC
jgi:hypothetical protein